MMFWIIGYIALVAYAAGLFTWSVAHNREPAAVGILLTISGLQLAVLESVSPAVGVGIAIAGLVVIGRDIALTMNGRRVGYVAELVQSRRERHGGGV
jgi:hypothetical protein